MDMGVYWALVAVFYPLLFGYFFAQISELVIGWWVDRKRAKRSEEATEHLAKE